MASPDDPDATVDAQLDPAPRPLPPTERIELPVYRPRRRVGLVFWCAFVVAALLTALVVWIVVRVS